MLGSITASTYMYFKSEIVKKVYPITSDKVLQ